MRPPFGKIQAGGPCGHTLTCEYTAPGPLDPVPFNKIAHSMPFATINRTASNINKRDKGGAIIVVGGRFRRAALARVQEAAAISAAPEDESKWIMRIMNERKGYGGSWSPSCLLWASFGL